MGRAGLLFMAGVCVSSLSLGFAHAGPFSTARAIQEIEHAPPSAQALRGGGSPDCTYQLDDGTPEDAIGVTAGGDMGWFNRFSVAGVCGEITAINIVFSLTGLANGTPGFVYVWEDPNDDGDPADAVLLHTQAMTVQGVDTGVPIRYVLSTPVRVSGTYYVGSSVTHVQGQRPASIDLTSYIPGSSWAMATQTPGGLNPANPSSNQFYGDIASFGFPGFWLIRAEAESINPVSYQGRLEVAGSPYTGAADLRFALFDAATGGSQLVGPINKPNENVVDGLFTVSLGLDVNNFNGSNRWIEVQARVPAGAGPFTTLTPRQLLTNSPQSLFAFRAPWGGLFNVPFGFADGVDDIGNEFWQPATGGIAYNSGRVGIGTSDPRSALHITQSTGNAGAFGVHLGPDAGSNARMELVGSTLGSAQYIDFAEFPDLDFDARIIHDFPTLSITANGVSQQNIQITSPTVQVNGTFVNMSDERAKHDIRTLKGALDAVAAIRGVRFKWNADAPACPEGDQIGLIAQEVEKVLPELVVTNHDGTKAVSYTGLVPVLVEAIHEMNRENADLRARVEAIEAAIVRANAAPSKEQSR